MKYWRKGAAAASAFLLFLIQAAPGSAGLFAAARNSIGSAAAEEQTTEAVYEPAPAGQVPVVTAAAFPAAETQTTTTMTTVTEPYEDPIYFQVSIPSSWKPNLKNWMVSWYSNHARNRSDGIEFAVTETIPEDLSTLSYQVWDTEMLSKNSADLTAEQRALLEGDQYICFRCKQDRRQYYYSNPYQYKLDFTTPTCEIENQYDPTDLEFPYHTVFTVKETGSGVLTNHADSVVLRIDYPDDTWAEYRMNNDVRKQKDPPDSQLEIKSENGRITEVTVKYATETAENRESMKITFTDACNRPTVYDTTYFAGKNAEDTDSNWMRLEYTDAVNKWDVKQPMTFGIDGNEYYFLKNADNIKIHFSDTTTNEAVFSVYNSREAEAKALHEVRIVFRHAYSGSDEIDSVMVDGVLSDRKDDVELTRAYSHGAIVRTLMFPADLLQTVQNSLNKPYYITVQTVQKPFHESTRTYKLLESPVLMTYDPMEEESESDCRIGAVTEPPKSAVVTDAEGNSVTDAGGSTVTTVLNSVVTVSNTTDVTYYLSTKEPEGTETVDTFGISMEDDIGLGTYQIVVKGTVNGRETVMTSMTNDCCTTVASSVTTSVSVVSSTNDEGELESDTTVLSELVTYPTQVTNIKSVFCYHDYPDGVYTANVKLTDLAGNTREKDIRFVIDNRAPAANDLRIVSEADGLLNYLSFGIFGSESIYISVRVSDDGIGCDRSGIRLHLQSGDKGILPERQEGDLYVFPKLDPDRKVYPYLTITDRNGNCATYLIRSDTEGRRPTLTKLSDLADQSTMLMLERSVPETDLLPTGYLTSAVDDAVKADPYSDYEVSADSKIKWYPWPICYEVTAQDKDSGLNGVSVQMAVLEAHDDPETLTGDKFRQLVFEAANPETKDAFSEKLCADPVRYSYELTEEGRYVLFSTARDNAGNPGASERRMIGIDLTDPKIERFEFNGQTSDFQRTESLKDGTVQYEYFFRKDATVRVFAMDKGSGLATIHLYLDDAVSGTSDTQINVMTPVEGSEDLFYADFTVQEGYKGTVFAEAFDKVGRTTGVIDANGTVIENYERHQKHSSIQLDYEKTNAMDANGIPLYNHSVPIAVTVKDSFSGIQKIEWKIVNDNLSGTIEVDRSGQIKADNNIQFTAKKEENSNLVTEIQFNITAASNTNNNQVVVILTDNAENTTENAATYLSIDTTSPSVSAHLVGPAPHSGNYYNSPMTVEISVTERNFSGSDVNIWLNQQRQGAAFSNDGIVGDDTTVHNAAFQVGADGIYTVTVSYTDRAGNDGNQAEIAQFVIDLTAPSVRITAVSDNETKQEELSQNALNGYFGIARNCVVEVSDTNLEGQNVTVLRNGANITDQLQIKFEKGQNGGQVARFKISQNGTYDISASANDLAGNRGSSSLGHFTLDKTQPSVQVKLSGQSGKYLNADTVAPEITVSDPEKNLRLDTLNVKLTQYGFSKTDRELIAVTGLDNAAGNAVRSAEHTAEETANVKLNNLTEDGIYELTVSVCDKAGRVTTHTEQFSVNRKGSTYRIENTDGRESITAVDEKKRYYRNTDKEPFSFRVTEVNVNHLQENEIIVRITRDGNIVENTLRPKLIEGDETAKEWCVYQYDFNHSLFKESGKYIVKLYSVDQAGNENPIMDETGKDPAMLSFFIDNDSPILYFRDANDKSEFLGNTTYHADNKKIEIEVYDNSQLEPVDCAFSLMQDGKVIPLTAEHTPGSFIYVVDIPNNSSIRDLSASVTDFAGNEASEQISQFYVTKNLFVLWYTNKPLMIGTIAGFILLLGAGTFFFLRRKRA